MEYLVFIAECLVCIAITVYLIGAYIGHCRAVDEFQKDLYEYADELEKEAERAYYAKPFISNRENELMTKEPCEYCDGAGELYPECTCYEVIGGGHQMGCCFYGMKQEQIQEYAATPYPCPDCNPIQVEFPNDWEW